MCAKKNGYSKASINRYRESRGAVRQQWSGGRWAPCDCHIEGDNC